MSKVHTLCFEFEHDYLLFGINCTLEDYKLAYHLNAGLKLHLTRQQDDLDIKDKHCGFTWYQYYCRKSFATWSLLTNKHIFTSDTLVQTQLFQQESKIAYLVGEKKSIDYFLKVNADFDSEEQLIIIRKIKKIPGIAGVYNIDPVSLKSKNYLIF